MRGLGWDLGRKLTVPLDTRITNLEDTYVRACWFEEIASGTSGTLSLPTNGTVVLNQWEGGVDALASKVSSSWPSFESLVNAGGTVITATLDASGNWTLSDTPSSYPITIIYVYRVKLVSFNDVYSMFEAELEPVGVAANTAARHTQGTDTTLGAQTQGLNMNTHKITGVVDPTANQEAATKKYVDDNSINNVVEDTTPQFGGNVDTQNNEIQNVKALGIGKSGTPSVPLDVVSTGVVAYNTRYSDNAYGPTTRYRKARGTPTVPTDVQVNDRIGGFYSLARAGGVFTSGGYLRHYVTAIAGGNLTTVFEFYVYNVGVGTEGMKIIGDGGIMMINLKNGIDQATAGAVAGELWYDTNDNNTVKMGV